MDALTQSATIDCPPQEYAELERKLAPFLDGQVTLDLEGEMQIEPLRAKFVATTREWEQTTKDADMLEEELKEEKVSQID